MYLLDTSSFRSISNKVLEGLCRRNIQLYASPYVFWELLCHIDEEDFDLMKGILMKFFYVDILNDPWVRFETPLIPGHMFLQQRVSDKELIQSALGALDDSDTLNSFYSKQIKDSIGRIYEVSGCSDRVRIALDEHEGNYINYISNLVDTLNSGTVIIDSEEAFNSAVSSLVDGHVKHMLQRGAPPDGLFERVLHDTYIFHSYIAHSAVRYHSNGAIIPNRNDYEDSCMCLHLKLDTPYSFVTNDRNLRRILERTISQINEKKDSGLTTTLNVHDTIYLERLL